MWQAALSSISMVSGLCRWRSRIKGRSRGSATSLSYRAKSMPPLPSSRRPVRLVKLHPGFFTGLFRRPARRIAVLSSHWLLNSGSRSSWSLSSHCWVSFLGLCCFFWIDVTRAFLIVSKTGPKHESCCWFPSNWCNLDVVASPRLAPDSPATSLLP